MKWWAWAYAAGAALFVAFVMVGPRRSADAPRLQREVAVVAWAISIGIEAPVVGCDEGHTLGSDDRCVLAVKASDGVVRLQGLRCDIDGDVAACRYEAAP